VLAKPLGRFASLLKGEGVSDSFQIDGPGRWHTMLVCLGHVHAQTNRDRGERKVVQIFMFKSEGASKLRALTGDRGGEQLPRQHGPWYAVGVVNEDKKPPHNLDRGVVEQAIGSQGFLLYRLKAESTGA